MISKLKIYPNYVILVHQKLIRKLITLEDFNNLHNATTQTSLISRDQKFYKFYLEILIECGFDYRCGAVELMASTTTSSGTSQFHTHVSTLSLETHG